MRKISGDPRLRRLLVSLLILAVPAAGQSPEVLEFRLNTYTSDRQSAPALAADDAGNFVAVWTSWYQDGRLDGIFGRRFDARGTPRGDELQVNTVTTGSQKTPSVASDAAGNFVVVWATDVTETGVFAQRFDSSGARLGEELTIKDGGYEASPRVACDAAGNFVVVWQNQTSSGDPGDISGRRYDHHGIPQGDELQLLGTVYGADSDPAVTVRPDGTFQVVWARSTSDPDTSGILSRRFDSLGRPIVEPEIRIHATPSRFHRAPAVDSDMLGNSVVVWQGGDGAGILGRRLDAGGQPVGDEIQVNTFTGGSPSMPTVASDPGGEFLVLWQSHGQFRDRTNSYFGQHFSSSGTALGGEFLLSSVETGLRHSPAMAATGRGGFVAAYVSATGDVGAEDVFGRLLGAETRPGALQLETRESSVVEGDTAAHLTVQRVGGNAGDVTVDYLTRDGTAAAGHDYLPAMGTLGMAAEDGFEKTFSIRILDDELREGNETFEVLLADPGGGAVLAEPAGASVLIVDNDFSGPGGPEPLGPELIVNSRLPDDQRQPQVAALADGGFAIAWQSHGGAVEDSGIFVRRYDRLGEPAGSELRVPDTATGDQREPAIATDPEGNLLVAWTQGAGGGGNTAIRGKSYGPAGEVIAEEFEIVAGVPPDPVFFISEDVGLPELAALGAGRFQAIWRTFVTGRHVYDYWIRGRELDAGGTTLGDVFTIHTYYATSGGAVASAPGGDFVTVWQDGDGHIYAILGPGPGRIRVDPYVEYSNHSPWVAADSSGNFTVVWEHDQDVYARRFDSAGVPLGDPFRVNSFLPERQSYPHVAFGPSDRLVVVWQSFGQDGSGQGIYGQRYDRDGLPVGYEFPVHTTTQLDQLRPRVAFGQDGEFVVTWESERPDSGFDVLAQRFAFGGCVAGDTTLCLQGGRFEVAASWRDAAGASGAGRARRLTDETGWFWFFEEDNVELVVKVLDGRTLNGHFWLFHAGMSNVEYTLTVTDTVTGAKQELFNPLGRFNSTGDILAFEDPRVAAAHGAGLEARPARGVEGLEDDPVLRLHGGRFTAEVIWRDFAGNTGAGRALALTESSGAFWFFGEENFELAVKVVDGRVNNGHFWLFFGGLTNVEYSLTVTDNETMVSRTYSNPLHSFLSAGDIEAF